MLEPIFDFDDGDIVYPISDDMAIDFDGNILMRMGDCLALDMDTGELHITSSWPDEENDDQKSSQ